MRLRWPLDGSDGFLMQAPHLGRQQAVVLLLPIEIGRLANPALRQISATGIPSEPCFKMNAFWASENFEAFIVLRSSQPGIGAKNSNHKRPSLSASDQILRRQALVLDPMVRI